MIVLGASNDADRIDPGLRSGRPDRTIRFTIPGADDLPGILHISLGSSLAAALILLVRCLSMVLLST